MTFMVPNPIKFIEFGDIHGPKPFKFIGLGDIHGPKPCEFIGVDDTHGPKPEKFTKMVPTFLGTCLGHCEL